MIETVIVNGKEKTLIPVSPAETQIPPSLLQGKREPGYIIDAEGTMVSEWFWDGFTQRSGVRCLSCDPLEIQPVSSLFPPEFNPGLPVILARIRQLALLMQKTGSFGYLAEDSFFLVTDGRMLLLPKSIIDLQQTGKTAAELDLTLERWVRPGFRGESASVYLLTAYLYRCLTGILPIEDRDNRDDSYTPIPPALLCRSLDPKTSAWMQSILAAGKSGSIPDLSTWLEQLEAHRSRLLNCRPAEPDAALGTWREAVKKRARRKRFLRRYGTLLMGGTAALAAVIIFAASLVSNALKPPSTAGLPPEAVVAAYYQSHNDLDTSLLQDTLARGTKSPAETMITHLFVTTRTRLAYEQRTGIIPAQEWLDAGMPETNPGDIVFGVTGLEIRQTGPATFTAEYSLWIPDSSEEFDSSSRLPAVEVRIVEELDLTERKNVWEISALRRLSEEQLRSP